MNRTDFKIPKALYSCYLCAEDYSWPAEDMAWSELVKQWVCSNCWDDAAHGVSGIALSDVIEQLTAERDKYKSTLETAEKERDDANTRSGIVLFECTRAQEIASESLRQRDASNARYDEVLAALKGEPGDYEHNEAATLARQMWLKGVKYL